MGGNLRLVEKDRLCRVDAGGEQPRSDFAGAIAQLRRILPNGDRVQVNDAINRFHLALHIGPALDRTKVVAKLQTTGGFDAGKDAGCECGLGHEC